MIDFEKMKKMPWFPSYPEQVREALKNYTLPFIPVSRFIESSAKYYPNCAALVYEPENFIANYSELLDLSQKFASGLQNKFGVKKGDRVAIYSRNCPEIAIAIWGIFAAGAIYVTCNPLLVKKEFQYQIETTQAKILIVSDEKLPVVMELLGEGGTSLETVIVFSRDQELKPPLLRNREKRFPHSFVSYSDVFSPISLEKPDIDPLHDLATIMYTSGTTSYPKGVMISHYNAVSASILYGTVTSGCFPIQDEEGFLKFSNHPRDLSENWDFPLRYGIDEVLSVQPWTHMMGFLGQLVYPIMSALTIVQLPVFSQESMLSMIQRYKIAFAGGAPMLMTSLLSRPDIEYQDISCLRYWTTGGAPTAVALAKRFEKKISGVISEAWTLTEATMVSTKNYANRSGRRKYGSAGIPLPFTAVKVVDMKTGTTEMPIGEEGELIQKGPTVAIGYYNLPEDTQNTFKDGWLYTGDIGKMDEDGFFYITGRKKELIKYKGYNIAPKMLEEVLYQHPAVHACAVIGKQEPLVGEIPVAFVQLKEGMRASFEEIMEFANEKVAPYKKIRQVIFMQKLPFLASGKLNRLVLNEMLEKEDQKFKHQ